MEQTTETSPKRFNAKLLMVAAALVLSLLSGFIGYELADMQGSVAAVESTVQKETDVLVSEIPYERQTLEWEGIRLSVLLPIEWDGTQSPDYAIDEQAWYEPATVSGANVGFFHSEENSRVTTAEEYVNGELNNPHIGSNVVLSQRIVVDDTPAHLILTTHGERGIQDAQISFLKNGRKMHLSLSFESFTIENQEILRTIINSARFES